MLEEIERLKSHLNPTQEAEAFAYSRNSCLVEGMRLMNRPPAPHEAAPQGNCDDNCDTQMTVSQFAKKVGLRANEYWKITRACDSGEIKSVGNGKLRRIQSSEIERYKAAIESRKAAATTAINGRNNATLQWECRECGGDPLPDRPEGNRCPKCNSEMEPKPVRRN